MAKFIKTVLYSVCVAICVLFVLSFVEVLLKNGSPNPQYSSFNVFNYIAKAETGTVERIKNNVITITTSDGNKWEYELTNGLSKGDKVKIWFDDNGTETREDDKITRISY